MSRSKKIKKIVSLVTLFLIFALALVGCGESTETSKQGGEKSKDTLVVAQGADVKALDPHKQNEENSNRVLTQIHNRLVEMNEKMQIEPSLAEKWEQKDPVTWEFKIRKGVKFHNGEELKASDVKFTFDRMKKNHTVAHIVEAIDSVEVDGDYKVIIKTKYPFGALLAHLAHPTTSILNEKVVQEKGDNYGQHPIGTGPFEFKEWVSGDKVVLEGFEDYWGGAPKIKKVTYKSVPESSSRTIGLETGEFDIAYDIPVADRERVKNDENIQFIEIPYLGTSFIEFNTTKKPLDNKLVRQAICYAVDIDAIINSVYEGGAIKAKGPISDMVFGAHPNLKTYDYNPEKAKELLKEADLPNGFDITLWTNDNPGRIETCEVVQAQLKEVGINVKIETLEWGAYLDRTSRGEHDMCMMGWVSITGDADYGLFPLFHSSQHGSAGNRSFYTNPEVDKLLEKGRTSTDEKERLDAYKKAQEIIMEDASMLLINHGLTNCGAQKYVKGLKLHPSKNHWLYGVYLD